MQQRRCARRLGRQRDGPCGRDGDDDRRRRPGGDYWPAKSSFQSDWIAFFFSYDH